MKSMLAAVQVAVVLFVSFAQPTLSQPQFVLKWGVWGNHDGGFDEPLGIGVDPDGNVYVADLRNDRIQKFDSNGKFLTKWGSGGSGWPGKFFGPHDVAADANGNVYVVDTGNHRIQKFDGDGNPVTMWGRRGTDDGQFEFPVGVAVSADGHVYVTDRGNGRIQKFDSDGNFILKWPGERSSPRGVSVGPGGNVYVSESSRIVKFDAEGNFITSWDSPCVLDVAADSRGYAHSVESTCDAPGVRTTTGDGAHAFFWGTQGGGDGQFLDPRAIAVVDAGGDGIFIYVSDILRHDIQKFHLAPIAVTPSTWTAVKKLYRD